LSAEVNELFSLVFFFESPKKSKLKFLNLKNSFSIFFHLNIFHEHLRNHNKLVLTLNTI
jgi:hypothetical protein